MNGIILQKPILRAALGVAVLYAGLANASEIKSLRVDTGATGTRAELLLDSVGQYKLIDLRNPDRLVVDFPASSLRRGLVLPQPAGVVKSVRSGQPQPGTVRIVFDLASNTSPLKPRIEQSAEGPRLVLEWPGDGAISVLPAAQTATAQPGSGKPAASKSVASKSVASTSVARTLDPIAEIARKAADTPVIAVVADDAAVTDNVVADSAMPTATQMPGVVATGVPTRIATGQPAATAAVPPITENVPAPIVRHALQPGMRPLVIAIDPGHGGQDPGSRGPNGGREKDVVLAIARELARQVNATPGLKAFLTRDSDVFIPLPQRARLARAAKADIFLSIHADAWTSPTAKGAGIFVLSTRGASSQRARMLADKENASDSIGGEQVHKGDRVLANVLLDLTQSGNLKASEEAASHILDRLDDFAHMHKNEVERANFAVLRTSDRMPAMLVETGFISNPGEEAKLRDPAYQRQLASAILYGVDRYFARQPPPGTLYAARALSSQASSANAGGSP